MPMLVRIAGGPDPEKVMRDTWGHQDAAPNVRHPGTIVFAAGEYGDLVILHVDLGANAGYGPWFYEHVHHWLCEQPAKNGTVYRWTGWYRHTGPDDETGEFCGTTTLVPLPA